MAELELPRTKNGAMPSPSGALRGRRGEHYRGGREPRGRPTGRGRGARGEEQGAEGRDNRPQRSQSLQWLRSNVFVKPGNFLERGQICATIIQLNPITFVAGVPEYDINKVRINQNVNVELVTGQKITGKLTFVSKSASPDTRTFSVESQIENLDGAIKDGLTANMTIEIDKVKAHKISPSILLLNDEGKLGIRVIKEGNLAKFVEIIILEDSEEGLWVTGIPEKVEIIIQGQGFVEDDQEVITNRI